MTTLAPRCPVQGDRALSDSTGAAGAAGGQILTTPFRRLRGAAHVADPRAGIPAPSTYHEQTEQNCGVRGESEIASRYRAIRSMLSTNPQFCSVCCDNTRVPEFRLEICHVRSAAQRGRRR